MTAMRVAANEAGHRLPASQEWSDRLGHGVGNVVLNRR